MELSNCAICGIEIVEGEIVCDRCSKNVPPSLLKACVDPFDYALGLKDGTIIRFEEAEIHGKWVTVRGTPNGYNEQPCRKEVFGHLFPRGLDLRIDDIYWCADAPDDS